MESHLATLISTVSDEGQQLYTCNLGSAWPRAAGHLDTATTQKTLVIELQTGSLPCSQRAWWSA
ncbi:hypothetical protein GCM10010442_41550 [Kitasatospora kifunensis]|uniref:Uncharacterized protein n=1 Tax=Kitasatospora kifunensis TaxID=58351 RepID=A0A7W7R0H7_KITKI|nr:hypothetical protein [Kitasatospora kifunensis]